MSTRHGIVFRHVVALLFLLLGSAGLTLLAAKGSSGFALVLRIDGVIGPASADYIHKGLAKATARGAQLVVIEMDTPGGLDTSMRSIIKDILASPVPVAGFVAPEGARAASAGTYILYTSHIAAMAPATNLGAATPVAIGLGSPQPGSTAPREEETDTPAATSDERTTEQTPASPATSRPATARSPADAMAAKSMSDATAYIRSLAQLRGRDVDFAERAVREAASLSAEEALAKGVIDIIAMDTADLLHKLDGREIAVLDGKRTLATADLAIERLEPDWRNRILAVLANPQVALILMMIGIYGLFFEFTSPGFGVPGIAGAMSLLVALYAFQLLPVNWAGVLLLAVGAGLMLAEAFLPSFGALGIGGIIAFVVGGLFLMDAEVPGFGIPLALIVGLSLASAAILLAIGNLAARSLRRAVVSGPEEMLGAPGTVIGPAPDGTWWIAVHGENWRARADRPLVPGTPVRVERMDGLVLHVSPTDPPHPPGSPP
ncbi:Putative membrane-bound ClpP-class protease associated with aq_911 [Thauera humireducens]|uniref:NfeD family protein n=1 Tax=Thauera humireducens TaxID=1134435 RepID=UPI002467A231|nr:nodulation protein NfeD [Thauera humireducens]CAH1745934.1 Putative membrane-bound ClpP-class protease associated with aq_911 [Thauera humireducens]